MPMPGIRSTPRLPSSPSPSTRPSSWCGANPMPPRCHRFSLCNRSYYVVSFFATLYPADIPLLLDANFNTGEIEAIRSDCGLDVLILERAKAEGLALPGKGEPVPFADNVVLLPL